MSLNIAGNLTIFSIERNHLSQELHYSVQLLLVATQVEENTLIKLVARVRIKDNLGQPSLHGILFLREEVLPEENPDVVTGFQSAGTICKHQIFAYLGRDGANDVSICIQRCSRFAKPLAATSYLPICSMSYVLLANYS